MSLPQLVIDGEECWCPDLRKRAELERYIDLRTSRIGRYPIAIEWCPDDVEEMDDLYLVGVKTISKAKTLQDAVRALGRLMEGGIDSMAVASRSIGEGAETMEDDIFAALDVLDSAFSALEAIEELGGLPISVEALAVATTILIEELGKSIDDQELGRLAFLDLAIICERWVECVGYANFSL